MTICQFCTVCLTKQQNPYNLKLYFRLYFYTCQEVHQMNNVDWAIILTLAKEKNMTRAAEQLFISQPSLSYRLKRMEEEFQVPLFFRLPNGIKLTQEGEYLYQYAKRMQREYRELQDKLFNMHGEVGGVLHMGAASVFANTDLPLLVKNFCEMYPAVEIILKSNKSSIIYKDLVNGDVDLAIVRNNDPWPEARYLLREEPVCLVSKTPVDFKQLPWIPQILTPASGIHTDNMRWWQENYTLSPKITMEIDNMDTAVQMVLQGLGWAIIPEIALRALPPLCCEPLYWADGTQYTRKTWLMCRHISLQSRPIAAFISFLMENEKEEILPGI